MAAKVSRKGLDALGPPGQSLQSRVASRKDTFCLLQAVPGVLQLWVLGSLSSAVCCVIWRAQGHSLHDRVIWIVTWRIISVTSFKPSFKVHGVHEGPESISDSPLSHWTFTACLTLDHVSTLRVSSVMLALNFIMWLWSFSYYHLY